MPGRQQAFAFDLKELATMKPVQGTLWSAFAALALGLIGLGCELVATVDRDQIGGGSPAGAGGTTGGTLGSGGDGQGGTVGAGSGGDMTPDGSAGSSGGAGGDDTDADQPDGGEVVPPDTLPDLADAQADADMQGDIAIEQQPDADDGDADDADTVVEDADDQ
jgi:hypothetical protein